MKCLLLLFFAATHLVKAQPTADSTAKEVEILFTIVQDVDTYEQSAFGEPPQFGIWLQQEGTGEIRTVSVTEKTGKGSFEGKVGVPVALPAWIAAYRSETGRNDFPTLRNPVVDGVTGPTTRQSVIEKRVVVKAGTRWNYYIEVNVAGDYNNTFPHFHDDGKADADGNGQPSLIYGGEISALPGTDSQADLLGRTEQLFFSPTINTDLNGITTANQLFPSISVSCQNFKSK